MKTETVCPHCKKDLGRKPLPSRDRDRGLTTAIVKLFGRGASRSDVSLCQACEKPARLKQSECVRCFEEFEYYAIDWKARKKLWCQDCMKRRGAIHVKRHRSKRRWLETRRLFVREYVLEEWSKYCEEEGIEMQAPSESQVMNAIRQIEEDLDLMDANQKPFDPNDPELLNDLSKPDPELQKELDALCLSRSDPETE